jgi:Putative zinc-finger
MSCERQIERIQELVDGTLGAIRRSELELHLSQCPACRALKEDLERIRDAAAALPTHAPPDGAWLQIAGRLRQDGQVREAPVAARRAHPYAWLAIAATLVLAAGVSIFLLFRATAFSPAVPGTSSTSSAPAGSGSPGNATAPASVEAIQNEVNAAQAQFEKAITKMDDARKANMNALDPQTSEVIEKNLDIIDRAIAENRAAVKAEPASVAARATLFEALRQKVSLLQDTISLINEMRRGNNAAAAQLVNKS